MTSVPAHGSIVTADVQRYYDAFAMHLLNDFLNGNRRVTQQFAFVEDALTQDASRILVAGCGLGDLVAFLDRKSGPKSQVMGIDISASCIDLARRLFPESTTRCFHERDLIHDPLGGPWDLIVLPDVYEHISREDRANLAHNLRTSLSDGGRVLLTIPSPLHQRMLLERGQGLQIVDEIVTLEDLTQLAQDLEGWLSYYAYVSAFRQDDYVHAIIETRPEMVDELVDARRSALKRCQISEDSLIGKVLRRLARTQERRRRRRLVKRRLGSQHFQGAKRVLDI